MLHRKNRIRRAFSLFMLWSTTLAAVGMAYLHFKSQGRKWQRIVLTDPNGGPWSLTSGIINPYEINETLEGLRKSGFASEGWNGELVNGIFSINRHEYEPWARNPSSFTYRTGPFVIASRIMKIGTQISYGLVLSEDQRERFPWNAKPPIDPENRFELQLHRRFELRFPAWFAALGFSIWPLIWVCLGPLRMFRRRRKGLCIHCAYDLTGNTSGVCPECGTAISPLKPKGE